MVKSRSWTLGIAHGVYCKVQGPTYEVEIQGPGCKVEVLYPRYIVNGILCTVCGM